MEALNLATVVHPLMSPKYVTERESFLGSFTVLVLLQDCKMLPEKV